MRKITLKPHFYLVLICALSFVFVSGCRKQIGEVSKCNESRDVVKAFYSFHGGNEMKPSEKGLKKRAKYITKSLFNALSKQPETDIDYFTKTNDYPRAFRISDCKSISETRSEFSVLMFWKTDDGSVQKIVTAETVKESDSWLIDKVSAIK